MQQQTAVKWTLLLVSILSIMAGTAVTPALPSIQQAFAGQPNVEVLSRLVLTMPALFIVIFATLAGAAADKFGRKKLLAVALVLYALSGASGYVLDTLPGILVGRALLGIAVAITITTSTALIADYFEGAERSRLMGLQMTVTTVGAVFCLTAGGYLGDISWRQPFLLYLLALLLLPLVLGYLHEPKLDTQPVQNPQGIVTGRLLMGVIFVLTFIGSMAIYCIAVQLPFYLESRFQTSGLGSGLIISSGTICATFISLYYGHVKRYLSYPLILSLSYLMMGVGFVLVGWASSVLHVVLGLCLAGGCSGLMMPVLNNWLAELASSATRGKVLGALTSAIFLGQFLSPIILTPLVSRVSYGPFFVILGCAMLLLWLTLLVLKPYLLNTTTAIERQLSQS